MRACSCCTEQSGCCTHGLPLDDACAACERAFQQRENAHAAFDFLAFNEEYYHQRKNPTITDVSAGEIDINVDTSALREPTVDLDDKQIDEDIDLAAVDAELAHNSVPINPSLLCTKFEHTALQPAPVALNGDTSPAGSEFVRLSDPPLYPDTPTPEQEARRAFSTRSWSTTVTDVVAALGAPVDDCTVVRPISAAAMDLSAGNPAPDPRRSRTIAAVGAAFNLNEEQQLAFHAMAAALLQSMCVRMRVPAVELAKIDRLLECLPEPNARAHTNARQLVMMLTGAGGTGKSRIIKALREFAHLWRINDMLCVSATTGVAACLIRGCTWHAATGHTLRRKKQSVQSALQSAWCGIDMLIIDEISMLGASQLYDIDMHLRGLKGVPGVAFGGVRCPPLPPPPPNI